MSFRRKLIKLVLFLLPIRGSNAVNGNERNAFSERVAIIQKKKRNEEQRRGSKWKKKKKKKKKQQP